MRIEAITQDIRHASRALAKSPVFTVTAVLTLALAIGANTAIYSAVQAVLLRPLPVEGIDELVVLQTDLPEKDFQSAGLRANEVYDLMDRSDLFQSVSGYLYRPLSLNLTGLERPQRVAVLPTLRGFFDVFRVHPHLGRFYDDTDAANGNTRVVVLSYGFWRDFTGEDPAIVGETIQLDDESYEVVGVLPNGFQYPQGVQLWTPHPIEKAATLLDREGGQCCLLVRTIARPHPHIAPARLQAELESAKRAWAEEFPDIYATEEILTALPFI